MIKKLLKLQLLERTNNFLVTRRNKIVYQYNLGMVNGVDECYFTEFGSRVPDQHHRKLKKVIYLWL